MTNKTWSRVLGWGQVAITYINDALAANGGVIPTTKAAWLRLVSSLIVAAGIHIASGTSVAHPNGK